MQGGNFAMNTWLQKKINDSKSGELGLEMSSNQDSLAPGQKSSGKGRMCELLPF